MRKVTIVLLLSVFLFNTAGYIVTFKILQYQVKKEIKTKIKQHLNASQLTTITIGKKQLKSIIWAEKDREFYYCDELYDIIRVIEDSSTVTYYCINDKKEEALFENLDAHIDRYVRTSDSFKNRTEKKLSNQIVKLYFTDSVFFVPDFNYSSVIFYYIHLVYTPAFIKINSPPPEIIYTSAE